MIYISKLYALNLSEHSPDRILVIVPYNRLVRTGFLNCDVGSVGKHLAGGLSFTDLEGVRRSFDCKRRVRCSQGYIRRTRFSKEISLKTKPKIFKAS